MPGLPVEAQTRDVVEVVGWVEDVFDRFQAQIFSAKIGKGERWVGTTMISEILPLVRNGVGLCAV